MQKLRIGIVGCGEVAQIIHIPALRHLSSLFDVTALCDVSDEVQYDLVKAAEQITRLEGKDGLGLEMLGKR